MLSTHAFAFAIPLMTLLFFQTQFTNASWNFHQRWPFSFGRRYAFADNNQESSAFNNVILPEYIQRHMDSTQFNCDNLHNFHSIMSNAVEEEGVLGRCPSKLVVKTIKGQSILEIQCQCIESKCHNINSECIEQKEAVRIGNNYYRLTTGCFCQRRHAIPASVGTLPRKPWN